MWLRIIIYFTTAFMPQEIGSSEITIEGKDQVYWKALGAEDINTALSQERLNGIAKNVILFVGDGMGLTTTTSARIYGKSERDYLSFEKFPNIGVLKTYSSDNLVSDSCSSGTALFCGVKANLKTSGVDATVKFNDCQASLNEKAQLKSIIAWAQSAGKSTGFVTTTRVTHATPSALFAHTPNRHWECEAKMPPTASQCKDIARQLIEDDPGRNINVIMGGGRQCLVSNAVETVEDRLDKWACISKDGRDLITDWRTDKIKRKVAHAVINNNEQLNNIDVNTEFTLGIFANSHINMTHSRSDSPEGMPSLTNMTEKALTLLRKNNQGFLLMVEGGLIDFAHHRGHARQALSETVEFSNAIERVVQLTQSISNETLIIVTSDHSHSLVFAGHAERSSSILDIGTQSNIDHLSFTPLLYGTGGPDNYQYEVVGNEVKRRNPLLDDTKDYNYAQQSGILLNEVKHSGTDVLVYAKGPMAHLFHSVHEQTYVAYVISYAANIGPLNRRDTNQEQINNCSDSVSSKVLLSMFIMQCFYVMYVGI